MSDLAETPKLQEQWNVGIWFGKTFETDSHIILTEKGIVTVGTCEESLEFQESLRPMLLTIPKPQTGGVKEALRSPTRPMRAVSKANSRRYFSRDSYISCNSDSFSLDITLQIGCLDRSSTETVTLWNS